MKLRSVLVVLFGAVKGAFFYFVYTPTPEIPALSGELEEKTIVVGEPTAVLKCAFDCYPQLQKVLARTDAKNTASIRVLDKLGFSRELIHAKDEPVAETIYGIMRDEWLYSPGNNNSYAHR